MNVCLVIKLPFRMERSQESREDVHLGQSITEGNTLLMDPAWMVLDCRTKLEYLEKTTAPVLGHSLLCLETVILVVGVWSQAYSRETCWSFQLGHRLRKLSPNGPDGLLSRAEEKLHHEFTEGFQALWWVY